MTSISDALRATLTTRLRRRLIEEASSSGGWGYYPGKQSRIEPSAWALLALAGGSPAADSSWQALAAPHLGFFARSQRADGVLVDGAGMPPNFASNGIAACVLTHLSNGNSPVVPPLLDALMLVKGIQVDAIDARQDNSLQAWPWMTTTFSWIEPTAWCMLALKTGHASGRRVDDRLTEAELVLVNRSCGVGGWNYGNASALGQDLRPYVPNTALGLLALQDRRHLPVVGRALAYLDSARLNERSALALAHAAVCLRVFAHPVDDVEEALAGDIERIERIGNLHAVAMALYALDANRHQVKALRV